MNTTKDNINDFRIELSSVLNTPTLHKKFRYDTLLLVKKYFDIKYLSFVLHDDKFKPNIMKAYLDNVTIGIPQEMVQEYYDKYQHLDPFFSMDLNEEIVSNFDILSEEEFRKTEYYKKFFSRYPIYYQVTSKIKYEDRLIAHISYGRSVEDNDFTAEEKEVLREVNEIISIELIKALTFRALVLRISVLEEYSNIFPIAQVIMDTDFNINFYNEYAEEYIKDMTGSDIKYFEYFFVNELIRNENIFTNVKNRVIEYNGYLIKIERQLHDFREINAQGEVNYIIYITKEISTKDQQSITSKYMKLLTVREREVVNLMRKGYSNKEIGNELSISSSTVKTHIQRMYAKCDANNRIQLINNLYIGL